MIATKRAVAMATRVVSEDEGNSKVSKSIGNGDEEGNFKEEGNGEQ